MTDRTRRPFPMPKATMFILPPGRSSIGKPESWPLSSDAARILGHIAPTAIPILCVGSSGTAFTRIATSLHAASDRARLIRLNLRDDPLEGLLTLPEGRVASYLTLALDGIEQLDGTAQRTLAAYLDGSAPRLVCGTRASLEELQLRIAEPLFLQLATVTVDAPALRERADEIPHLAEQRLALLANELQIEPAPRLTPSAAAALAHHDWPGDVTEFDAVLLGTLLREGAGDSVDAHDLAWRNRPARPATPDAESDEPTPPPLPLPPTPVADAPTNPTPPRAHAPAEAERDSLDALESVAVELAHQLKNPLVTVKTFVTNASRMDEEETARFREIALEGIERIDGPLDQILDFSRLTGPTTDIVEVSSLLTRSLDTCAPALEGKQVSIQGLPPTLLSARGASAYADFALSTLCRHVADTIEPHSVLTVSRPATDLVRLHYRESGASTHLRGVTGDPDSSFPLALLLVRGALTRMGGGLRTSHAHNEVTIELSFTPA